MTNLKCPCHSGKEYDVCCQPFHKGKAVDNALLLMRSRYSAYALNNPDYIMETTHPKNPQYSDNWTPWRLRISEFSKHTAFEGLEILDFQEDNLLATVTFTAYLTQEGQNVTFTEKSYFEKVNDRWFYLKGEVK